MIVLLAGSAIAILVFREITVFAPTREARRLQTVLRWCAIPVLVMFAAAWLIRVQALLTQAP